MTAPVRALRPDQPADAPDAPGVAFSAWNYGHELARSGAAGLLGAGPYTVLHTLASHANKQAQAEVGFGCLARETGLCRGAVIKAIARLIECRAIGRLQRRNEDTMVNAVNLYTIFPIEGIIAHPAPERRREQARALARSRQESRQAEGGSQRTVTSSEQADPSYGVLTTPSYGVLTTPSQRTATRVVNTREPKASPLSVPLLSIPNKHSRSGAARAAPPPTAPQNGAHGHSPSVTPAPRRRARDHLDMVATTDDPQAPRERRLGLKLAGDVLGCMSVNVERLACYERFCAGLLAHDYTAADLCRWMDWMNSGTAYWVGNARKWTQQRMMDDLADWDGHGRPASKEDGDG